MIKLNSIIDKIMPYKVIAEGKIIKLNEEYSIKLKGFTKRFIKEENLNQYVNSRIANKTFCWNYTMEENTCYVSPGSLTLTKAVERLI